jgi:hypothetical protein
VAQYNEKPPSAVKDSKLLPIDDYKGKSIAELEAILDAHNKTRPTSEIEI